MNIFNQIASGAKDLMLQILLNNASLYKAFSEKALADVIK